MCAAERSEDAFVFDREAVDEAAHLQDWRIRGRLRSAVRMRGGILADKVGYGKTATTIGLVECTRAEGAPRPPSGWGGALTPSRATLVLCPVNLITQWVREVQKFVAGGLRVIPLQTYAQLKRVSAQELADADVVVTTYRLFYSAPYLERLRQVACLQSGGGRGGPDGPVPAALRWPPREQLRMGGPDARRRHSLRTFSRQYAQVMSRLEGAGAPVLGAGGASWRAGAGGQPSKRMRAKGPADAASRQRAPSAHGAPERVPDAAVVGGGRPGKRMRGKGPREAAPRQRALGAHEAPERALGGVIAASAGRDAAARPARAATGKAGKACGPKRAQGAQGPPLLSCFHWKRLVLDEFHELLTRHPPAQVIVQSLSSKYRWGLSGTLPCKKTADVVKMAAFFGADLAGIKHRSQAPRAVCQQWLDHCARRNVAGLQELKSEEEIVLVRQHPAERALYLQLAHAASDLDLVGEDDAAALLSLRRRGQEGLVKLCSHFQLSGGQLQRSALDECDAVLQRRTRELASSRQAVRRALEEARALVLQLEPVRQLVDGLDEARRRWAELWSSFPPLPPAGPAAAAGEAAGPALAGGPAGETRRHLRGCLADAEASASAGAAAAAAGAPEPLRQLLRRSKPPEACCADALQAWRASKAGQAVQKEAAELHKRALQAVAGALRAMKTLEACARLVHFFDVTVRTARDEELMRCPICLEDIPLALRCVLPCAHLGCTSCVEEAVRRDARCPVCRASATPRQVMRLEAHLGADGGPAGECGRYGSKITKLLNFLASLQEREPSAKVILFVQWEDLKRKVAGALEESNMAFEHLRGGVFARQRTIERFQHEEGGSRVLLLSLEDSASGTNLTRANHVILFHPVVSGTREAAVACEMQAVGRALRAGQERPVKVWRFVTAGTVEQRLTEEHQRDLWERWQRRVGRPADGARG
ncbi:unnamed protein product [Prorocentrum cordatum]|nr:unnamed protein product [Polarella glacialis]